VNNLVTHIDGRAILCQGALDNLDRAHDAGAKTSRLRQNDLHRLRFCHRIAAIH
jgi:hypothetical protein